MPVSNTTNSRLKAAVSVSEMAKLVELSRARFYDLMTAGVFIPPVYSLTRRRPFFTADMQQRNLEVRQTQRGVNGDFVLFYDKTSSAHNGRSTRSRSQGRHRTNGLGDLLTGLRSLGLETTQEQVDQAVRTCYPGGVNGTPETEVLRAVYRHLRRSNGA